MRSLRTFSRPFRGLLAFAAVASATPAVADENVEVDPSARIEFRYVQSDLDFDEGETIDSSGYTFRGTAALDVNIRDRTLIRAEGEARNLDFNDPGRNDRFSYGGAISIEQKISQEIELRLRARRVENSGALEASSVDQTTVGARVQWGKGNDRVRVEGEYVNREYDLLTPANGEGFRVAGQYNRRLGSYHWLRFDLRYDQMRSEDSPRRSYNRVVARVKYSHPISKRVRIRPAIEYRSWSYKDRVARGDPDRDLREDSYLAPSVELSYGRWNRGPYATASLQYRLRTSNDIRFDSDALRAGIVVGYRF